MLIPPDNLKVAATESIETATPATPPVPLRKNSRDETQPRSQSTIEQQGCAELFTPQSTTVSAPSLTTKELQLLELLSFGYENGDIADHFQTSRQAVKNMLRTINLKLGADNRTHAVAIGFRNGLLPLQQTR